MIFWYATGAGHVPFLHSQGVRRVLNSFWLDSPEKIAELYRHYRWIDFFLDSGAHSFIRNPIDLKPDQYFDRYREFVRLHYGEIAWFAELDIEQKMGQEKVDLWARNLRQIDPDGKMVRVWHPGHSQDRWRRYVNGPGRMVALGGDWNTRYRVDDAVILRMIRYAYDRGVYVHGFGCMSNLLLGLPLYSVDGTTWLVGASYGKPAYFEDGKLKFYPARVDALDQGIVDLPPAHYGNTAQLKLEGLRQVMKFERFLDNYWTTRGVRWPVNGRSPT